jgi:hypothetical protein
MYHQPAPILRFKKNSPSWLRYWRAGAVFPLWLLNSTRPCNRPDHRDTRLDGDLSSGDTSGVASKPFFIASHPTATTPTMKETRVPLDELA